MAEEVLSGDSDIFWKILNPLYTHSLKCIKLLKSHTLKDSTITQTRTSMRPKFLTKSKEFVNMKNQEIIAMTATNIPTTISHASPAVKRDNIRPNI